ncbi:type II secretion system protein GspL [Trinickia fusca]|uniref:Type II secretion system protein GspL n=1 Tax=Trinickia fusca TaxID=2419777 RepID=A0A494XS37_9BURK|nr:type II secretion system protein GspL [Trinickia fusca]RKP52481.1 type II secretion system protein GspL [Trinickia fusca]
MQSLIVLLPSIRAFDAPLWQAVPMPYALHDRRGVLVRAGRACLDALPKAASTVLVISARDTLLLDVDLPPVTGQRLRRILPNVVEEFLIEDVQQHHIAVGEASKSTGRRSLAVIDRVRFAAVIDWFVSAGHRRLRAVPLIHCMPSETAPHEDTATQPDRLDDAGSEPQEKLERESDPGSLDAGETWGVLVCESAQSFEVAVKHGTSGFGLEVHAPLLDVTLAELSKRHAARVYALSVDAQGTTTVNGEPLAWEQLARNALGCPFDLCQFEFAHASRARKRGGLRPWRPALGLLAAALMVSVVAVNVQWWQALHRRDRLDAQITEVVKAAFPGTPTVLDPNTQMQVGLAKLRSAAAELRPSDYLVLASALSRALGPILSRSIAVLDYSDDSLTVTFKPGTTIDGDMIRHRLQPQGVSIRKDGDKWVLSCAQSAPR